ncbi:hypothetical protein CSC18_0881 [Klebsiella aerogenes]|nr:hypothetical protein CSC18_0881 [Klebsiella aerogenes]
MFPVTAEYCQEMRAGSHYDALFWLQKQRFIPSRIAFISEKSRSFVIL